MMSRAPFGSRRLRYAAATLLVAAVCGGVFIGTGSGQAVPTASVQIPVINGHAAAIGPEPLLLRTLNEVSNRRLDSAVTEIDKVIRGYPNFRLAHLIKGDLLLARARPLTTVGNAPGA